MTVSSSTSKAGPYAGNGSTTAFAFAFYTQAAADIAVIKTDSTGADTTLTSGTDYTVVLNADQTTSPGGTVTLAAAPASGYQITVLRNITLTQGASLPNQGGWYPKVVENALDKMTMGLQQLAEKVSRAVVLGVTQADPAALINTITSNAASAAASAASASGSASAAAASATLAAQYVSGHGIGGVQISGSITLVATSPSAMSVTPSAPGQCAILPVATTCSNSSNIFSIFNRGEHDYGVMDAAGNKLAWIRPGTGAVISLNDNSTVAGVWSVLGGEKTGVTAKLALPAVSGPNLAVLVAVQLDANRTCFVFGRANCYAVVYDASTQTWGSPTFIRACEYYQFTAILSAANQVLVVSNNGTAMEAVTLTISGTSITVNNGAKGTATLIDTCNASVGMSLVAVGASFVVSYTRTPGTVNTGIRAISLSGTSPTIGAESALIPGNEPMLFVSGSVVRCISSNGSQVRCSPFTVSGSSLTLGTAATVSATSGGTIRAMMNGNGNIVVQYVNTAHYVTIFKLTGTTESASSVNVGTVMSNIGNTAMLAVSAAKTAICTVEGNSAFFNIVTDTAGTASAGSEIQVSNVGTLGRAGASAVINGLAVFLVHAPAAQLRRFNIDFSGSSPALSSTSAYASATAPDYASADLKNTRNALALITANGIAALSSDASTPAVLASANSLAAAKQPHQGLNASNYAGIAGPAANESYFLIGSAAGTSPVTIFKVEAAA